MVSQFLIILVKSHEGIVLQPGIKVINKSFINNLLLLFFFSLISILIAHSNFSRADYVVSLE